MVQQETTPTKGVMESPLPDVRSPETPLPETEQQVMMRRLWKSDELIKQLKHIVKAQHNKIEELRERLESDPANLVKTHMASQEVKNSARLREDNEELRRHALRLKVELQRVKKDADTLRKANCRLKGMLQQEHEHIPHLLPPQPDDDVDLGSLLTESPDSPRYQPSFGDTIRSAPAALSDHPNRPRSRTEPFEPSASFKLTTSSLPRPKTTSFDIQRLPRGSKSWRLSSIIPMFWRDSLKTPASILNKVVELADRLLDEVPNCCTTVYLIDSWLRDTVATPADQQPALFYLGEGKTAVQVFRTDAVRPEAPRFQDLQTLPARTRTAVAVAVQLPNTHQKMAILQMVSMADQRSASCRPQRTPRELQDLVGERKTSESSFAFSDSHLMQLQMICNVAGGILEQLRDSEAKEHSLERMRSCVDITVAVNQARSLPDFEQRVKHSLGEFFGVSIVRVLFFDRETNELLISSAQMRRKGLSRLSLDKGVIGLCAKRQQVVHVSNISHHPYIDAAADGLQRSGRPISGDASMLVGPFIIEHVEGPRLIGIVQLLERRRKKRRSGTEKDALMNEDFSLEEQSLFQQLLRVCAQAAWRTYTVQELTAKVNNRSMSLGEMLEDCS
jgi:GAF domain-containing protein